MKHLKQFLLMAMLLFSLAPLQVSAKENIDVKEILWGHIKDSYEWHITKVGDHPVVIHLPIIVNTTSGWHVFCSSEFSEEKDANGDRPGPFNLVIKNADAQANPNKIVEKVGGQEVRPLDISITKTVCVLFIDAIILLLCVLIPARWCRKHKVDDPAPKGFVGLMHMFIMSVYTDVIKATLGKEAPKYAPWLLTCFFFIFVANIMGIVPFPPGGGNLTGNIAWHRILRCNDIPDHQLHRYQGILEGYLLAGGTNLVEGASATDAIHRALRNLYETAGSDYPTLRQHDGGSRHRTFVCGYHFHHVQHQ